MISVCIPTYNGAKYIEKQLCSILKQLLPEDEVIISDDSSTDDTVDRIRAYNDTRIRIYEKCSFSSPIFNLENALKQARGDYFFLADQDDIWSEDKVERMLKCLQHYDLVVSDSCIIDDNEQVIEPSFFDIVNARKGFVHNLIKNGYLGCAMAFNRKIRDYVLPFPKTIAMHDIWIGLNSEIIGRPFFLNEKLHNYRRHGGNASSASEKSSYPHYYRIWYRLVFLFEIVKRFISRSVLR